MVLEREELMSVRCEFCLAAVLGVLVLAGCTTKPPKESKALLEKYKDIAPVTGELFLDGAPAGLDVQPYALPEEDLQEEVNGRTVGSRTRAFGGFVKPGGKITFMTLDRDDGLKPGKYILMFKKISKRDANDPPEPEVKAFDDKYFNPQ